MIQHCFTFLHGISQKTEQSLKEQNINTWNNFINTPTIKGISPKRKTFYNLKLKQATQALHQQNLDFFTQHIPQREKWRLYPHFKDAACFLDIEVDGKGNIIAVTIYDKHNPITLLQNHLTKETFNKIINQHKLLITYNGSAFDIPKLEKQLNTKITIPHIDLKPLCQRLNLTGGLKEIERQLNIHRPQHLKGSPADAWRAYHASGDQEYLDLLVAYNQEDAINLHQLVEKCMKKVQINHLKSNI